MSYETELAFFMRLMANQHIEVHRFMPDQIPLVNLESSQLSGYEERARRQFSEAKPNTVYVVADRFAICYNYLLLPDTGELLLVGPYLSADMDERDYMESLERCKLPPSVLPAIRKYVSNLVLVQNGDQLLSELYTLGEVIWGGQSSFEVVRENISSLLLQGEPEAHPVTSSLMEAMDFIAVEERYKGEKHLMHLVSQGHTHRAQLIIAQVTDSRIETRTADPLRNMKNYGVVLNVLLRKAVEEGGVHPLYIDKLSSQMAKKLETMRSVDECRQFYTTMIHKYCLLVKNHSMKRYSLLIQHVILRIESDLTADLSLKAHADALSVNASYLSTLFKKETGVTLTEYVSRKRMDHAIFLLNATDMQVQTIAQYCGIPDVNYFTKTFKRIVGKTPKEYRMEARAQ